MNLEHRFFKWLILFFIVFPFCNPSRDKEVIQKRDSGLMTEHWLEDLNYFAEELPRRHKDLFFQLKQEEYLEDIEELKEESFYLKDYEIITGIMKITAKVGDSHTGVSIWRIPAFRHVPVDFKLFSDGIFATAAIEEYQPVIGRKLRSIDGLEIEKVIKILETIISFENEAQVKSQVPWLIGCPEILHALKIIPGPDSVIMEFEGSREIVLKPVQYDIEGLAFISAVDEEQAPPLYLAHRNFYYWYEWLDQEQTLYFQYNRCAEADTLSFRDFIKGMLEFIEDHEPDKFIFDMRLNGGGNSSIAEPLIHALKNNEEINREGKLFVCIGRLTFSSAILNAITLREETNAIFIGEPTGGKPNHYGEVRNMILPNSGITISYSTKYFKETEEDEPSFYPDIEIDLSSADFFAGRDPVLEEILRMK
ncbi:MAG: hypothetical protein AMS27_02990 [Bacteroides sp. SM23_62_1]|nr:MAG: hypothetical protein AMS27_02990 [Bacteroides sp. SM23_62_1]